MAHAIRGLPIVPARLLHLEQLVALEEVPGVGPAGLFEGINRTPMTNQLGRTPLTLALREAQVLRREQVVVIDVDVEVEGAHHGRSDVEGCLNIDVLRQLDHGRLLQVHDLKHALVHIPIALVVHLDQLLLESLLQLLDLHLVLPLHLLQLVLVDLAALGWLGAALLLLVRFLLLFGQDLDVLDQWGHRIGLAVLLLLGYALVHGVHEERGIFDLRFNNWPQLLN